MVQYGGARKKKKKRKKIKKIIIIKMKDFGRLKYYEPTEINLSRNVEQIKMAVNRG